MLWMASMYYDNMAKTDDIVSAVDGVAARLQEKPVDKATLDRALIKMRSKFYDDLEALSGFGRANLLASFALFDDNPERINTIETDFRKVTPELIRRTARDYLRTTNQTVVIVEPGAAKPAQAAPSTGGAK
jgi:predicted Zn-dependent peptidase